jgi:cysteinyl-tRNA synthetase
MRGVLGFPIAEPADYRRRCAELVLAQHEMKAEDVERRIAERNQARAAKDFARADVIRNELAALGILLKDTPAGTTWYAK